MMENAIFSVISPEGCASILFKDASKAEQAAESLKLTAYDLFELGIVDEIQKETEDFNTNPQPTLQELEQLLYNDIFHYSFMDEQKMKDQRYNKYRSIGFFETDKNQLPDKILNNINGNGKTGNKEGGSNFFRELGRLLGFK